jgi:predicted dinucleotide-binding enzyme
MVSAPLELVTDALEVVELAVGDEVKAAVLVRHRLITGDEVDDAEARVTEAGPAGLRGPDALGVRPTVMEASRRAAKRVGGNGTTAADSRDDSAHGVLSRGAVCARVTLRSDKPWIANGRKNARIRRPRLDAERTWTGLTNGRDGAGVGAARRRAHRWLGAAAGVAAASDTRGDDAIMRIAIVGAGNVGGTLGRRFAALGHDVAFGVRNPAEGASAVKGGDDLPARSRVASVGDAVKGAEVVVLATPWNGVRDALEEAGASRGALDGVVLVDSTNPLGANFSLDVGPGGESGGERVQAMAPRARVVKAFNTTGFNNMVNPVYGGEPTVMCYAGGDAAAKATVRELVAALGFDPVDAGPLRRARELEHLASLWIYLAYGGGLGREIAFRLVRR